MLGLGWGEMAIIGIVALLVIPPDRLPHAMRQLGRWYGQIRRSADELRRAFVLEADRQDAAERYRQLQERRRQAQEVRKRAEAETGGGAQPLEAVGAPEPQASVQGGEDEEALTPNDIPPDAPHPAIAGEAAGRGGR